MESFATEDCFNKQTKEINIIYLNIVVYLNHYYHIPNDDLDIMQLNY